MWFGIESSDGHFTSIESSNPPLPLGHLDCEWGVRPRAFACSRRGHLVPPTDPRAPLEEGVLVVYVAPVRALFWLKSTFIGAIALVHGCGSDNALKSGVEGNDAGGTAAVDGATDSASTHTAGLLFGGSASQYLSDTWVWDGSSWTQSSVSGPSPRYRHSMAGLGGKVVLFGGVWTSPNVGSKPQYPSETWLWDGAAWNQAGATGPGGREGSAMATLGDKVVLFGGTNVLDSNSFGGDTWLWDGASWTQANVGGPPGRDLHAMATLDDKIVLFGGFGGPEPLGDTWTWDGKNWTQLHVQGPPPRLSHAMATLNGKIVLFGGTGAGPKDLADTWLWDGSTWKQAPGPGPSARSGHAMTAVGDKVVMFGGAGASDTWLWDGSAWAQSTTAGPSYRESAALAALAQ
jgi:N-acetylneuraminic acid mutarotase